MESAVEIEALSPTPPMTYTPAASKPHKVGLRVFQAQEGRVSGTNHCSGLRLAPPSPELLDEGGASLVTLEGFGV